MLAWADMFVWGDLVRLESPYEKLERVWEIQALRLASLPGEVRIK